MIRACGKPIAQAAMDAATVRQDEDGKIGYGTFSGGILGNARRAAINITRVIGIDAPSCNVEPPPYPTPIVETGSGDFEALSSVPSIHRVMSQ